MMNPAVPRRICSSLFSLACICSYRTLQTSSWLRSFNSASLIFYSLSVAMFCKTAASSAALASSHLDTQVFAQLGSSVIGWF